MERMVSGLMVIVGVLVSVGYLTLVERKVLGLIQGRRGPNVVGVWGVLQPLADGLKLLKKEIIVPRSASKGLYLGIGAISLVLALGGFGVMPMGEREVLGDIELGVLYLLGISSLGVYSVLMGGWASNNRYSYIGGIRAAAQMVSYELSVGLVVICVVICAGIFSMVEVIMGQRVWYLVGMMPLGVMYYVSMLAETMRVPFDLTEAESELISGYNVEYGGMLFGVWFIAEYAHIVLMGYMGMVLFLGGVGVWKLVITLYVVVWVRGSLPRVRYDQLMGLLWKSYLIGGLGMMVLVSGELRGA